MPSRSKWNCKGSYSLWRKTRNLPNRAALCQRKTDTGRNSGIKPLSIGMKAWLTHYILGLYSLWRKTCNLPNRAALIHFVPEEDWHRPVWRPGSLTNHSRGQVGGIVRVQTTEGNWLSHLFQLAVESLHLPQDSRVAGLGRLQALEQQKETNNKLRHCKIFFDTNTVTWTAHGTLVAFKHTTAYEITWNTDCVNRYAEPCTTECFMTSVWKGEVTKGVSFRKLKLRKMTQL